MTFRIIAGLLCALLLIRSWRRLVAQRELRDRVDRYRRYE